MYYSTSYSLVQVFFLDAIRIMLLDTGLLAALLNTNSAPSVCTLSCNLVSWSVSPTALKAPEGRPCVPSQGSC